ncbi:uncharacterized protein LOC119728058 [Patiria miniata]|uniref:Uncharacterized protein n=1 Tax=Patiria miniata TaxID=46514 RepID=A0A913ZYC1_PATMI|nr:uncharacterized protein LOC119728058 [Patiria miniata]
MRRARRNDTQDPGRKFYFPAGILGLLSVTTAVGARKCLPDFPLALDSLPVIVSSSEVFVSIVAAVYCCFVMGEEQPNDNTAIQYDATQVDPQGTAYSKPVEP